MLIGVEWFNGGFQALSPLHTPGLCLFARQALMSMDLLNKVATTALLGFVVSSMMAMGVSLPGLAFAEMGPGDLGLALGYPAVPREPYPPEMREARERVFSACRKNRVAFLETAAPENITAKLDEGVRVIAGHREETSILGRAHQKRTMPV